MKEKEVLEKFQLDSHMKLDAYLILKKENSLLGYKCDETLTIPQWQGFCHACVWVSLNWLECNTHKVN